MKTPQQIFDSLTEFHEDCRGGKNWVEIPQDEMIEIIAAIQKEAFEEGRMSVVQFMDKELDGLINIPTNPS